MSGPDVSENALSRLASAPFAGFRHTASPLFLQVNDALYEGAGSAPLGTRAKLRLPRRGPGARWR